MYFPQTIRKYDCNVRTCTATANIVPSGLKVTADTPHTHPQLNLFKTVPSLTWKTHTLISPTDIII